MPEMIQITIDGIQTEVPKDTMLLAAARGLGIDIPTFCHREPVEPYGACRICIVEVTEGKRTKIVPSCVYPVRGPITVSTNSERVQRDRKMLVQFELARCSEDPHVVAMAKKLGVDAPHPRLTKQKDDCIVCGLCVRTCAEVVGADALGFEGRGQKRRPVAPYDAENPDCIACGACAYVCPTQCIEYKDDGDGNRVLPRWHRKVPVDQLVGTSFQLLPPGIEAGKPSGIPPAKERKRL
jgi:bidirectional [NiFe] hydrogenase diaphorase subunit